MTSFELPAEGLTILHSRSASKETTTKEPPQIIQLNLVESITKELLRSIRNNEQVRLKLGKKPTIHHGKKQLALADNLNSFPSEVFTGPIDGSKPMYFSGKLSHTLELQKARQDTAGADEKLAALENTLKSLKEERASTLMKNTDSKKDNKLNSLTSKDRFGTTTPSSPYLGPGQSPRLGPTSNPLLSTTAPTKEKIRQDAMRIPMVHLLAMGPMSPKAIARKLNASVVDCEWVLDRVAKDTSGGNKDLKDKSFRELDIWKFPYHTDEDREAARERAIHAYDRMRIEKNDPLWQLLLPKEERGKGTTLSRLNFYKPTPTATTPKVGPDGENKAEVSDKERKVKTAKATANSKEAVHKKKLSSDATTKKKGDKAPTRSSAPSTKQDAKFKSSERIEDSDEEAEGVEVVPAKPKTSKVKERDVKTAPLTKEPKASQPGGQQHKSKLSNSSTGSSDIDRRRVQDEKTRLKPQVKSDKPVSTSRISPRPRTDSSPLKPSPLRSSPPTNSTDLETSSKSSTQSSAPSSPPSSTDVPLSQTRKNYSPVITGRNRDVSNSTKRKAEKNDGPPAKRQQVHGLGLPKSLTDHLQQPTPVRRSSSSSLSSPERSAPTKQSVIAAGKDFKIYYDKYKDLHVKLTQLEPRERSDKELEKLWKMHERLEIMKSDLWANWAKAGGEV